MKNIFFKTYIVILLICSTHTNAQVINAGVGGNNTNNLLERLDKDVLMQNPDLVVLMVGTNDMLNSNKMNSYEVYDKNLKELVFKLKKEGFEIVLMSPPPVDSIYLFERHGKKMFTETPNVKMAAVRQIVSQIANDNNLKFIDLFQVFKEMKLPKHNEDLFFKNSKNSNKRDGVHPTDLGYQFIGETVFYFLKEHQLLEKNQKIICFGDSITNGNRTRGETYPVTLQNKIELYFKQ